MSRERFWAAMACYAALAGVGWWRLDGGIRLGLLVFLAGLAARTAIAAFRPE